MYKKKPKLGVVVDPYIFLSDPDPWIWIPERKYGSGSGRLINYGTGRIRVLSGIFLMYTYSKDADPDSKVRITDSFPGGQLIMDLPDPDPHTDKEGSACPRN